MLTEGDLAAVGSRSPLRVSLQVPAAHTSRGRTGSSSPSTSTHAQGLTPVAQTLNALSTNAPSQLSLGGGTTPTTTTTGGGGGGGAPSVVASLTAGELGVWRARSHTATQHVEEKRKALEASKGLSSQSLESFQLSMQRLDSFDSSMAQVRAIIEGSVTRLGAETTERVLTSLQLLSRDVQRLRTTSTHLLQSKDAEMSVQTDFMKAEGELVHCLRSRADTVEAEYRRLSSISEVQETLMGRARTYVKVVIAERLAWQEQFGANAAKLPLHDAPNNFLVRCHRALAAFQEAEDRHRLPSVGMLESTESISNRFAARVEKALNGGGALLRYVPPAEEIQLLNDTLKNSGSDVRLHKELGDRMRKFSSMRAAVATQCEGATKMIGSMRSSLNKLRDTLAQLRSDETFHSFRDKIVAAVNQHVSGIAAMYAADAANSKKTASRKSIIGVSPNVNSDLLGASVSHFPNRSTRGGGAGGGGVGNSFLGSSFSGGLYGGPQHGRLSATQSPGASITDRSIVPHPPRTATPGDLSTAQPTPVQIPSRTSQNATPFLWAKREDSFCVTPQGGANSSNSGVGGGAHGGASEVAGHQAALEVDSNEESLSAGNQTPHTAGGFAIYPTTVSSSSRRGTTASQLSMDSSLAVFNSIPVEGGGGGSLGDSALARSPPEEMPLHGMSRGSMMLGVGPPTSTQQQARKSTVLLDVQAPAHQGRSGPRASLISLSSSAIPQQAPPQHLMPAVYGGGGGGGRRRSSTSHTPAWANDNRKSSATANATTDAERWERVPDSLKQVFLHVQVPQMTSNAAHYGFRKQESATKKLQEKLKATLTVTARLEAQSERMLDVAVTARESTRAKAKMNGEVPGGQYWTEGIPDDETQLQRPSTGGAGGGGGVHKDDVVDESDPLASAGVGTNLNRMHSADRRAPTVSSSHLHLGVVPVHRPSLARQHTVPFKAAGPLP